MTRATDIIDSIDAGIGATLDELLSGDGPYDPDEYGVPPSIPWPPHVRFWNPDEITVAWLYALEAARVSRHRTLVATRLADYFEWQPSAARDSGTSEQAAAPERERDRDPP